MNDLLEFLRARFAEDEATALRCGVQLSDGKLHLIGDCDTITIDARRVLAEVDAKRRIIDAHPMGTIYAYIREGPYCNGDDEVWPCDTMRALALPYAGHKDYRDEWKP